MLINKDDRLSFEKSRPGRKGVTLPSSRFSGKKPETAMAESLLRKRPLVMPELSEPEVIRHFVNLSRKNFSVDTHFYPLGSCTMKYNPKVNEWAAMLDNFASVHPLQPVETMQGFLQVFYELEEYLKAITGMDRFTLQPAAGAHGELTGMMLVHAYHEAQGQKNRKKILVPDSSHGTNPASAALLNYRVVELKSNARGRVDLKTLEENLDEDTACLMLTNPNTLGLFEADILEVTKRVHAKGGLLYYDGANLNALMGLARPGDMGFDIVHLNLHKTFSTPHGGGGPGSGPVGVKKELIPYLPRPLIAKVSDRYVLDSTGSESIGRVKSFYGNSGVILRAWVYVRMLGLAGIKKVSEDAILNANYLMAGLKGVFPVAMNEPCMHEFVLSIKDFKEQGIHSGDIGKRLLDFGIHAPTVHFPLVVEEALMIEPTETESRDTLDHFLNVMKKIAEEIKTDPNLVKHAPHTMPITRPDEVLAARKPILCFRDQLREKILKAEGIPAEAVS